MMPESHHANYSRRVPLHRCVKFSTKISHQEFPAPISFTSQSHVLGHSNILLNKPPFSNSQTLKIKTHFVTVSDDTGGKAGVRILRLRYRLGQEDGLELAGRMGYGVGSRISWAVEYPSNVINKQKYLEYNRTLVVSFLFFVFLRAAKSLKMT